MMLAVISRPSTPTEGISPGSSPAGRHGRATV
jgi:hypothetical protein